jgi:hypothetical protein
MYFEDFPNFLYEYNIKGQNKSLVVTDITRNIRFRRDVLANVTVYDEYDIIDGETPEIIAEKIYGNAEYHWVIMLANNRFDYTYDFPMRTPVLEKFIEDKYGETADDIKYYIDANAFIVDSTASGAVSISHRQYEERLNESKRRIKIVSPKLLDVILKNYKDII